MTQDYAQDFKKILDTIAARAQTGLAFSSHPYDIIRYQDILDALGDLRVLLSKAGDELDILSFLKNIPNGIGNQEYVTPKVAVATVVFNDRNEILLVKRLDGIWTLPGGYADIPYDPIENASKEVKEETGLDIKISSLIGIFDSNINKFPSIGRQVYLLVFLGKPYGGNVTANSTETKGVSFFDLQSLPEILPTTLSQIQYGYRMYKGETLPPFIENRESSVE